ncbi:MAG: type III-B CRISPR module RAMP protein Cmr6 [Candidatus Solibacter sp.]
MTPSALCPLYGQAAGARNDGHAGLYYDKFFGNWLREDGNWSLKNKDGRSPKQEWINEITKRIVGDAGLLGEYRRRIWQLVTARGGQVWVYKTEERLVTGTGRSHPVENGFVWHPVLGVPYLPGSSIKGLIGQADREKVLGSRTQVGRVICLDAVPICPVKLEADVMTPHYSPWSAENPPGDWRSPTPIPFLTVAPGAEFLLAGFPRTRHDSDAVAMVGTWLEEALRDTGAGAKTAVGYGRMNLVPEERVPWLKDLRREAELAQKARLEQQRLARMDPLDRELEEIGAECKDPNIKRWALWLKELERSRWPDPNQAKSVAQRIRAAMEADASWRPETRSKNPAKDHGHQKTILVMKHLA